METVSLLKSHPFVAKQWHPILNTNLTIEKLVAGSDKKAWWQCNKGHEWEASIRRRALRGMGCPFCANKSVLIGFNDLATINPSLASEWHPTKMLLNLHSILLEADLRHGGLDNAIMSGFL